MSHHDDNLYTILGKLAAIQPKPDTTNEKVSPQKIYESVDARGSILNGVDRVQSTLATQFAAEDKDTEACEACTMGECSIHNMEENTSSYNPLTGVTTNRGNYGTEYQGDPEEDGVVAKAVKPSNSKTGKRGRPTGTGSNQQKIGNWDSSALGSVLGVRAKMEESMSIIESQLVEGLQRDTVNPTFQHILDTFKRDVKDFETGGEMSNHLYDALYDYYFDDMPYGTQKARDGDPMEWVCQRFESDLGLNESSVDDNEPDPWKNVDMGFGPGDIVFHRGKEGIVDRCEGNKCFVHLPKGGMDVWPAVEVSKDKQKRLDVFKSDLKDMGQGIKRMVSGEPEPSVHEKELSDLARLAGLSGTHDKEVGEAIAVDQPAEEPVNTAHNNKYASMRASTMGPGEGDSGEKAMHPNRPTFKNGDNALSKPANESVASLETTMPAEYESIKKVR